MPNNSRQTTGRLAAQRTKQTGIICRRAFFCSFSEIDRDLTRISLNKTARLDSRGKPGLPNDTAGQQADSPPIGAD
jgi:hypothetical protein